LSYPDAQRYRLGTNYEQIPVNRCPLQPTLQRDGKCARTEMGKPYFPNSFDEMQIDQAYKEPLEVNGRFADWYDCNCEKTIISPNREIYLKLCPSSSNKTA
jgi:catalase